MSISFTALPAFGQGRTERRQIREPRLDRLDPDPITTPHVRWIFQQRLTGASAADRFDHLFRQPPRETSP